MSNKKQSTRTIQRVAYDLNSVNEISKNSVREEISVTRSAKQRLD